MKFTTAVVIAISLTITLASCGDTATSRFAGKDQASAFQAALERCLDGEGIPYEPVTIAPGAGRLAVPAPAPAAWWAAHGGYGLIEDQGAEIDLDLDWKDPNRQLGAKVGSDRLARALYGAGGDPGSFAPDSCYDQALRTAGFFEESRAGTLQVVPSLGDLALHEDQSVKKAQRRVQQCLRDAGHSAEIARDPEAELRHRFREEGLITDDGRRAIGTDRDDLERAQRLEQELATDETRCRQQTGLDKTVDRAIRRTVEGGGG